MVNVVDIQPGRVRPLRRAEYERLVETGAFDDEKIELLDGMLITMTPQDAAHAHTAHRLAETFTVALMKKAIVRAAFRTSRVHDERETLRLSSFPDVAVDIRSILPTSAYTKVQLYSEWAGAPARRRGTIARPLACSRPAQLRELRGRLAPAQLFRLAASRRLEVARPIPNATELRCNPKV